MTIIWWILGIIVYLVIGAVIAGLLENSVLDVFCFFAWPIVIILGIPMAFCMLIADKVSDIKCAIRFKIMKSKKR